MKTKYKVENYKCNCSTNCDNEDITSWELIVAQNWDNEDKTLQGREFIVVHNCNNEDMIR